MSSASHQSGQPENSSGAGSGVVVKSNDLVKAKLEWTTIEHRIILTMIAQLRKEDSEFDYQRVRLKDIIERSGSKSNDLYSRAEEICDKLLEQKVKVRGKTESGDREYRGYNLMSACKYVEGSGAIRAKFNPDMRPFLLELKRRFTMYRLQFVMRLSSPYAIRLYELIKMRQDLRFIRISVEELRETLSVEHKYDRFTDLKKHILEPARKEIKEKCDVYFTYRVQRDGRTPVGINFMIHSNGDVEPTVEELPDEKEQAEEIAKRADQHTGDDGASAPPMSDDEGQPTLFSGANDADVKLDATALFQQELSQEELSQITDKELRKLHSEAREQAERKNRGRSESILVVETYQAMIRMWKER